MTVIRLLLGMGILLAALVPSASEGTSKGESEAGLELLQSAMKAEDVWVAGAEPAEVHGEIQIALAGGKVFDGEYALWWESPQRWRQEIRVAGFERTRVQSGNGYWQRRNIGFEPLPLFEVDELFDVRRLLQLKPTEHLGKESEKKQGRERVRCAEVEQHGQVDRKLCIDEKSGALASVDFPTGAHMHSPEITRIEYSSFVPWAGKLLASEVRALRNGQLVAAIKVGAVNKLENARSDLLQHPQGADFWPQCEDGTQISLANRVQPQYPQTARANREQGRVIFYAVVEESGELSHITVIQKASPNLEAAALAAVGQWRYKPATCGGAPIRAETSIPVDFALEY